MIGRRLNLARNAAGLSLRALSDRIDRLVTAQAIGKYERDEAMPRSSVLIALADALDVTVDYLIGDPDIVLEAVEFRKKTGAARREEARVGVKVLDRLERYLAVEELLGLPIVGLSRLREASCPVIRDVAEADYAAQSLRERWTLGIDPIPNLVGLLEERGIKVLSVDMTSIDGLAGRVPRADGDAVPVIVVNRGDWGERQRFTLAHELGHLVMDVSPRVDGEKAAHRFAGAFLMPASALWVEIGRHRTSISLPELFCLKERFGASVQAITYRCKDLGIIGDTAFRKLFDEFKSLGWRDPPYEEPLALPGEEPTRFDRLTFRALAEGAVSDAKAAELLGLTMRELQERLESGPPVESGTATGR